MCNIKKIIYLSLIWLSILCVQQVSSQEIPVLKDVQIKSTVGFNKAKNIYTYSYKISNPPTNTGQIRNIQIDISKPEGGQDLSPEGLVIQKGIDDEGVMLTSSFEEAIAEKVSRLQKTLIPIGTQVPTGWRSSISVIGTASWGARGKNYLIMPGQSLDGFAIISQGLPAIRDISVHPKWVLVTEGDVTQEDIEKSKKIEEEITWKGKTIGPTAPPADFKPVEFLNYIINLKHQASSLGWITNKGIENSLDVKLDNAKAKLNQGNTIAAKNILEAFINEVEAQGCESYEKCPSGKHLTSEAYALMKYNVQYLINKL